MTKHVATGSGGIASGALRIPTIGLLSAITVTAFEAVAVATAMPTAARDLGGLGAYGWVFTGFLASSVLGMVAAGRVGQRSGPKVPLLSGMAVFALGLVVAGLAGGMQTLILGRVIQGLGAGAVFTAAYVVVGIDYPERLQARMLSAFAAAWVLPALIGPLIAGALAQHWTWRAVFLGLVPFVLAAAAMLLRIGSGAPADQGPAPTAKSDALLALHAVAVAAGVAAVAQTGEHHGPVALGLGGAGLVALAWGLHGLLPPGTLALRQGVGAAVAFRGLLAGAFFGLEAIVPLMLTLQHGWGATLAGLPLTATALTWAAGSWWQGRRARPDLVPIFRAGFGCIVVGGTVVAVLAFASAPAWLSLTVWPIAGLGAGLVMPSAGLLLLSATNDADRGRDSSALQLFDACMGALTTSAGGALLYAASTGSISYQTAFLCTAIIMCAIAAAGVALAGRGRYPSSGLT